MIMLLQIHPRDPEPRKVRTIAEKLRDGAVVVCPTDTVYAFVCSPKHATAMERVARLKGVKPQRAELSLVCKDLSQAALFVRPIDTATFRLLKRALPGPYTFILPAGGDAPKLFQTNRRTIGFRIPDHPVALALVEELGHPLVAASVHDPDHVVDYTTDPERIAEHLGAQVDLVIDAGMGGLVGSTVIDLSGETPVVLRLGKGEVEGLI
ncbi:MAG: threonylcarbamoyl-AMP synthase [Flavobacteriales bacterium]|nr:threonylcarbamoyl-AMP synthase [Flavobacteriales bacterium]